MSEEAKEKLRKGLDLLWQGFKKEKERHGNIQAADDHIKKVEVELKKAEDLFNAGKISEAAKTAIRAGELLSTTNLRRALALFRESNKLQREGSRGVREREFFIRATHLLDQAEAFLDDARIEEARNILKQYYQEKVKAGLTGPTI